jgi:class 3 adenylate cyclase
MPEMDPAATQYARAPDGVSLAYQTVGDGAVDLLWLHAFMGSLEVMLEHPVMRSLTERLTSYARVIRHDVRATGLSGRATSLPDLETQVQDAAVVLDAVGSRSTVIVGAGPGAHAALLFGATFPARTRALVLWDVYAWASHVYAPRDLETVTQTWGTEAAAAASMAEVAPSLVGDRDFIRWYAKVQRHFLPPDLAGELLANALATDVHPLLGAVHVPTLVLARSWAGHESDAEIAREIEGSTFRLLPGSERASFSEPQQPMVDAIREFVGAVARQPELHTVLRAVLFTDIVGSTAKLASVGDAAWRALIFEHDLRARAIVEAHGGRIVKSTGDGILAVFEGPAQAVRAAQTLGAAVQDLDIELRAGAHIGEIETIGDDVTGVAVNAAARISAKAGAGEVLVSSTLRDLVAGSGLRFEQAGEHELKGVPGTWSLFRAVPS